MTADDILFRAERWGGELSEPPTRVLAAVERLLFEHAPDVVGDCTCGWSLHTRRGISHATHLVQKLAAAGLLAAAAIDAAPEVRPAVSVSSRPSWRGRSFLTGAPSRRFADGTT